MFDSLPDGPLSTDDLQTLREYDGGINPYLETPRGTIWALSQQADDGDTYEVTVWSPKAEEWRDLGTFVMGENEDEFAAQMRSFIREHATSGHTYQQMAENWDSEPCAHHQ